MTLNFEELSNIGSAQELIDYIHKKYTWETISKQRVHDLKVLAFYEAFLKGADAVYTEMGNGDEFQQSALKYLEEVDATEEKFENEY